jgi:N-acyl-D-aspartate/D-glutamate deacylase
LYSGNGYAGAEIDTPAFLPAGKGDDASPALGAVKVVFSRSLVQLRRGLLASALGGKISTVDGGLTGPRYGHAVRRSPLGREKLAFQ